MNTQSSIILTETYYNIEVIEKLLSVNTTLSGYDDTMMWTNEQNKLREIKNNQIKLSVNLWITALGVCIQPLTTHISQCLT